MFQIAGVLVLALCAPAGAQDQPRPPRPTTDIPRVACVTSECHPGVKQHRFLHGPVNASACDSCHRLTSAEAHTFEPVRARNQMCLLCHVVEIPAGASIHKPLAEGECLSCHDPHGSNEAAMLRGEKYADSCRSCHNDVTGAHDKVHGPASAGACGACHMPHASRLPKLLAAEGRDLCLRCHVTLGLEIDSKRVVHKPALGDCLVCHAPHATDTPSLLIADPVKLCTSCHEEIGKTMGNATTQHGALTTKRECLNCHDPHASDRPRLLKNDEKSLCFECHNTVIKLKDGTALANIKDVIEHRKSVHGAIAERSCVVCHQIHGGDHRRLLTDEYPAGLYQKSGDTAYPLCFSCHDRQLVVAPRSGAVTSFRNGDLNLHYIHVNRDVKSRSCRICHDSHAADRDHHIRDEIPYGPSGWKLPIGYARLPDGGRCAGGCHGPLEYNREKPVTYPPSFKEDAWKGADMVPGVLAEPPKAPQESPRK
jgi:predicted CXXCH cytochrome family protein